MQVREPAWHRRERRRRSSARSFLRRVQATNLLNSHHGSEAPVIMGGNRVKGEMQATSYGAGSGRGGKHQKGNYGSKGNGQGSGHADYFNPDQHRGGNGGFGKGKGSSKSKGKGKSAGGKVAVQWQCADCGEWHPLHHKSCYTCYNAQSTAQQQQQYHQQHRVSTPKKNRWSTRHARPSGNVHASSESPLGASDTMSVDGDHVDAEYFDGDYDGKQRYVKEWDMPKEQVDFMMAWLKSKGADDKVIKVIGEVQEADAAENAAIKDPWRELQSTRDRIKNIEHQIDTAKVRQAKAKEALEKVDVLLVELDDRYAKLLKQRDDLTAQVSSGGNDMANNAAEKLRLIQEKIASGIPAENTSERSELYNIIFGRSQSASQKAEVDTASTAQQREPVVEIDENGEPFIPLSVDRKTQDGSNPSNVHQGKGFGPSGKAQAVSPSAPYNTQGTAPAGA